MPTTILLRMTTALATLLFATLAGADVRDPSRTGALASSNAVCSAERNAVCSEEAWRVGIYDGPAQLAMATGRSEGERPRSRRVSIVHFREPVDASVRQAAQDLLDLPLGSEVILDIDGRAYGFRLEPHYHPPGYEGGPVGWHKGVTLYQVVEAEEE